MRNKFRNISKLLFSPRYLIFTNSAIGSGCLICGYAIAGKFRACVYNDAEKQMTWPKIKLISGLGALYGTYETIGYYFIDKIRIPGALFLKVSLDQLILGPPAVCLFLMVNEWYDHNWNRAVEYTKKSFVPVYLLDMLYWLPVQLINFRFVQPRFRFAYVAVASILGNIVLVSLHFQFQSMHRRKSDITSTSHDL